MPKVVRFLDLSVDEERRRRYLAAIDRILLTGLILNGPEVEAFEKGVAAYCGTKSAVGVGSGTAALYLALKCLRIGAGDEVILPALSFVGTANAVASLGGRPVFVDVRHDLLIDPISVEAAISPRTKAIMPVHFTGNVCEMSSLLAIGERHAIPIIEDAAQAFGASFRGRKVGTFGPLGCFSMNPMKVLGAVGEAGIILVQSETYLPRLRDLRYHGLQNREMCVEVSLNERLDTIQAAILSMRLQEHEDNLRRRQAIASRYTAQLSDVVEVPRPATGIVHGWYTYTILCDRRDELAKTLQAAGVECKIYSSRLMPGHAVYAGYEGRFPVGQGLVEQLLCLPMHEKLTDDEIDRVAETVAGFYGRAR